MTGQAWKPTYVTAALDAYLQSIGVVPADFIAEFEAWKLDWPRFEYRAPLFGKDGAYDGRIKVGRDPYVLRHAHLQPFSRRALRHWLLHFRHFKRKTSDRHLVYVTCKPYGTLLIHILDEPTAHAVAAMNTAQDKAVMKLLCDIAYNFINYGHVP